MAGPVKAAGFDQDSVHYAVELRAPGLTARAHGVVAWTWDSDLTGFLEALVADYREPRSGRVSSTSTSSPAA